MAAGSWKNRELCDGLFHPSILSDNTEKVCFTLALRHALKLEFSEDELNLFLIPKEKCALHMVSCNNTND